MRYFANRIAQTELHRAFTTKQAADLMEDEEVEWVQWRLSVTHPRPDICDLHAHVDRYGLGPGVYPKPLAPLPPAHPHCLPGDAVITASGRIAAVTKRWFDGDLVVITTAAGKRLAATVNHPVLTRRGWVGAGFLDVGDEVVSRPVSEAIGGAVAVDNHHQDMPASIAEIADSFFRSGEVTTREVPTSAEDFHGDGMAGQVAVVGAYRQLWDRLDSPASESVSYESLKVAHAGLAGLFGDSGLDLGLERLRGAADSRMGGGGEDKAFVTRHIGETEIVSLAPISRRNAMIDEDAGDYISGNTMLAREGKARGTGDIVRDDVSLVLGGNYSPLFASESADFLHGSALDTALSKPAPDEFSAEAVLASQILEGGSGPVVLDAVVKVERFPLSGHVYNLETESGHYTANGIITHNCRCLLAPRLDLTERKGELREGAETAWLRQSDHAQRIVGSRAKWERVKKGADPMAVAYENVEPDYRPRTVAEAATPPPRTAPP
jgi:hypothetical protein